MGSHFKIKGYIWEKYMKKHPITPKMQEAFKREHKEKTILSTFKTRYIKTQTGIIQQYG